MRINIRRNPNMVERMPVPDSASGIALNKVGSNKTTTTPILASNAEVYVKGTGQMVVRRQGRGGPKMTHPKAIALQACGGKRGCDFAKCVESALGRAPAKLMKACGVPAGRLVTAMRVPMP